MILRLVLRCAAAVLILAACLAAETVGGPPSAAGESIEARVIAALHAANIPAELENLEFLAPLNLNSSTATFMVVGIQKWQSDSAMARIRCANSSDCMPFFVMLRWKSTAERDASLSAPVLTRQHGQSRQAGNILVHAGEQATLILESKKFRIATPVTCLENGTQGQKIRVRTVDHKKIQMAEVEDTGLLKGTL